jgi:tRNA pseudouridine55 synthase
VLGILLIDKPPGVTSHDVVNGVRRRLGTRRVGHAGTLDPLATGLLVVAVGPATRFLQYLPLEPKEYVAQIAFGRATDSYDAEGEVTREEPVPADLAVRLEEARPAFMGLIQQLPPMHSAIKVAGKPLYAYARQGQVLEREPRSVHIGEFEFQGLEGSRLSARIVCSGGTYVRSLAHDLGEAVGCGAHLAGLVRTRVGRFHLDQASPLDAAAAELLIPLAEALPPMELVSLAERQVARVREGQPVGVSASPSQNLVGLLDPEGRVFSVARVHGNLLQPECVIPEEAMNGGV